MSYRFVHERENYEDLASGRVLYNRPGATSFPVRLASEIFQRCKCLLQHRGNAGPYSVYDPCCGGAYLLTAIGFLHGTDIAAMTASDVDERAVDLAGRNLSLLTVPGIKQRMAQIELSFRQYGKPSHESALQSAERLKNTVERRPRPIALHCFRADITQEPADLNGMKADIVITDVPYGQLVRWSAGSGEDPIESLLHHIRPVLASPAVVAIVADKEQKVCHAQYKRVEQFKIGKRRITFLEPDGTGFWPQAAMSSSANL